MSNWVVVPSLLALRDEFNQVSPQRDKGADGTIGDTSHAAGGTSDHLPDEDYPALRNKDADHVDEVHALDIDSTGPWPWSFDSKIKQLIAEEKRRWLDPNDMCRLHYIIWNRYIYETENDFAARPYTGTSDPHTGHAHFSARYETRAENDTRPWGVVEEDDMDQAAFTKLLLGALKDSAVADALGNASWNHEEADPDPDASGAAVRRVGGDMRMMEARRRDMEARLNAKIAEVKADVDALKPTV